MAKVQLQTGQYQVIAKCYMAPIPGQFPTLYDPAASPTPLIVYYDGVPGPHLRPLDQAAHNNVALYQASRAKKQAAAMNPLIPLRSITDIPQHRHPVNIPVAPVAEGVEEAPIAPPAVPPAAPALADMLDDGSGPMPPKNKGGRPKGGGRPRGRPSKKG